MIIVNRISLAENAEGTETIINNSHNLSVLCVKSSMGFGFVKSEILLLIFLISLFIKNIIFKGVIT